MVAAATVAEPSLVADFAAGGGALLEAAAARWPQAALLATDIDAEAVAAIRVRHPSWRAQRLDFTANGARLAVSREALGDRGDCVVLLNPPFSERGAAARWTVSLDEYDYRCGRALAFACWAADSLSPASELICLLPAGVVHSERDASAMAALARLGDLEVTPCEGDSLFTGFRLRTVCLRLRRGPLSPALDGEREEAGATPPIDGLARGQAKAWTEASSRFRGPAFVHTTDLREGRVMIRRRLPAAHPRSDDPLCGPMVLVPRVGRPDVRKVCVWVDRGEGLVISDCVIAIRRESLPAAEGLAQTMRRSWALIEPCYGGTCAPYITLKRLAAVLGSLDIEVGPAASSDDLETVVAVGG